MKITTIPQIYRNANRWREILTILSKFGLAGWIGRFELPVVKGMLKTRGGETLAHLSRETRIRLAIEELGPTFIKLGQILSTRPDQIGMALADELQKLQTAVPADAPDAVRTHHRNRARRHARPTLCRFRHHAARLRVDRPGPPRARLADGSDGGA